jgi:hypothetical protein
LQTGGDPVDGQLDETQDLVSLAVICRQPAEASQQTDLQLRQRIDVGVSKGHGPLEDRCAVEEPLAAGHSA